MLARSVAVALAVLFGSQTDSARPPATCTYRTFSWSVMLRRAVEWETVRRPYADVAADEMDRTTGCTVCEEDQVTVELASLAPFRVCHRMAPLVRRTVADLLAAGEPIYEIVGYRVGRTRGAVDSLGHRTGFSSHSFGIAIDINPARNGLYDRCETFGPGCRLLRGGAWRPGERGALTVDGQIVQAMKAAGFRWGGEIAGQQKDFMHFSPSGY